MTKQICYILLLTILSLLVKIPVFAVSPTYIHGYFDPQLAGKSFELICITGENGSLANPSGLKTFVVDNDGNYSVELTQDECDVGYTIYFGGLLNYVDCLTPSNCQFFNMQSFLVDETRNMEINPNLGSRNFINLTPAVPEFGLFTSLIAVSASSFSYLKLRKKYKKYNTV